MHGGFLTLNDGKMAKSLGNVLYLSEIKQKGFSPMDYKYMCLTTHYRAPLMFSIENLESAKNTYQRLKNICENLNEKDKKINERYIDDFKKAIEDDLNLPSGLQILWKLLRDEKAQGKYATIKEMDKVLGLKLIEKEKIDIPKSIKKLVDKREKARKNKEWKLSDEIREKINKLGFIINDTDKGPVVKRTY